MDKCGFIEAWIGACTNERPCEKHRNQNCWKCDAPATRNCSVAGSLVCGVPMCEKHDHADVCGYKPKESDFVPVTTVREIGELSLANQRLIAAAPDMLEALQVAEAVLTDILDLCEEEDLPTYQPPHEKVRSAIKKALEG